MEKKIVPQICLNIVKEFALSTQNQNKCFTNCGALTYTRLYMLLVLALNKLDFQIAAMQFFVFC